VKKGIALRDIEEIGYSNNVRKFEEILKLKKIL